MRLKKTIIIAGLLVLTSKGFGQTIPADTIPPAFDSSMSMDTTVDYDDLLNDLDIFLDSLLAPRSYLLVNASLGYGYFDFNNASNTAQGTYKKTIYSPAIGYYHKSGPGITIAGNMIDDNKSLNLYQYSISPSFDFIRNKNWIGGASYTRYITKDSLPFYTTPLQNEVNVYYLYRKSWLQPGFNASYGWGSRSDVEKRRKFIRLKRLRRLGAILTTTTRTQEDIADFSLIGSVRHSFYWLEVFHKKDYIRFTPMITFSAGTQQYGFNQTTGTSAITARNTGGVLLNSGNTDLDDTMKFQPLAVIISLKPEYNIGKFFIQPQVILDYYLPRGNDQFTFLYSLNAGLMF